MVNSTLLASIESGGSIPFCVKSAATDVTEANAATCEPRVLPRSLPSNMLPHVYRVSQLPDGGLGQP